MKSKNYILLSALLLSVIFLGISAIASDFPLLIEPPAAPVTSSEYPCNDMANQSFDVIYAGVHYVALFLPGPFGPGLSGTVFITPDGDDPLEFPFSTATKDSGRMVIIEDFADFYYTGFSLIWVQGDLIELTRVEPVQ